MDSGKNDNYYIEKILQDMQFVLKHMSDIDKEELGKNELLLDSMLFRMIQISENAKKLSEKFKASKKNIPWDEISGLRNRIVHDYGNVDLGIVYDTLKNDIPVLAVEFEKVRNK